MAVKCSRPDGCETTRTCLDRGQCEYPIEKPFVSAIAIMVHRRCWFWQAEKWAAQGCDIEPDPLHPFRPIVRKAVPIYCGDGQVTRIEAGWIIG